MDNVVGFDLDMTLIDSAEGIAGVLCAVAADNGVQVTQADAVASVGRSLEDTFAQWLPTDRIDGAVAAYRRRHTRDVLPHTQALPGAMDLLAALRERGCTVLIVSGKQSPQAVGALQAAGLGADVVVGGVVGAEKSAALRHYGALCYVGDVEGDMVAAQGAGIPGLGITSGAHDAHRLTAAGATHVVADLFEARTALLEMILRAKEARLLATLASYGRVLVAFSGGVDSALVVAAAARAVGPANVVAATAVSDSLASGEWEAAAEFVAALGVAHVAVPADEMARAGYRANGPDRCFFCKDELMSRVLPMAQRRGIRTVATGTNADDLRAGYRPGIRAAAAHGAVTPLADVGLTKDEIRSLSLQWQLPTWDKPQAACLSSRIAYDIEITPARLARVDTAEAALRRLFQETAVGVTNLRVRDLGQVARIEVDAHLVDTVAGLRGVAEAMASAGLAAWELDPRGFRSGAMNEALRPGGQ